MLVNIENLHFSYGIHTIFNNLNLSIHENAQIGLIGRNGSGKSTFLKLLAGELIPDQGRINKKNDLTMSYLAQETSVPDEITLEALMRSVFSDLIFMEKEIKNLGDQIATTVNLEKQEKLIASFGELQDRFDEKHGYEYPSRIRGVLNGLGFLEDDFSKPFSILSGGEKTRATLGQILLKEPELLLLDEPTNYLDIAALQWLEQYLKGYRGSFVIISHDRYFLDQVCQSTLEVSKETIKFYDGNYTDYAIKKRQDLIEADHHYQHQVKELNRQKEIIKRFRNYNSIKSSKRANSREKALEKIEVMDKAKVVRHSHFNFSPKIKSGNDVLMVEDLKKSFGSHLLFQTVSFDIHRGDKIGMIGPNGVGKTSLFKLIQKILPKDSGTITLGHKVHIGYFDQEHDDLKQFYKENLLEALWDMDTKLSEGELRNILAAFLFMGEDVFKPIETLSGGEKARLLLARLMISQANFLMMDEPTNHIDMDTKEILENALSAYDGTLFFISHDRYFLNRIANKIFVFSAEGIKVHLGNYDDYLKQKEAANARDSLIAEKNKGVITKTQQKIDRKKQKEEEIKMRTLKRQLKEIEEAILNQEMHIEEIQKQMCAPNFYDTLEVATKINKAYEAHQIKLSELTDQWEEALIALENYK